MSQSRKRCAVYTRKSTEEGLEQDFNSLDAQAESCGAYILSQAGEGWTSTGQVYSDGGISGGHMERPGLQAMIADIEAGQTDVVVVYKVDRLTRSLADFAKLVDVFDRHDVSFVSITQAFNTTTSMGRLTLNVLLSFAQFEREVTAERIRDKIAASKRRGQWMGGLPPLGYDNVDKKLVINGGEAEKVHHIMTRYVELGSVRQLKLKLELDRDGYATKRRVTKKQSQIGGKPFSRGHLYKLLSNPVYIGKITHKEEVFQGRHEAIVDEALWEAVQSTLKSNAPKRRRSINIASSSPLTGLLFNGTGQRLSPAHTRKPNGRRYRYYVFTSLTNGEADDAKALWLPAEEIERLVTSKIADLLGDTPRLMDALNQDRLTPSQVSDLETRAADLTTRLNQERLEGRRAVLIDVVDGVRISPTQLTLRLHADQLLPANQAFEREAGAIKSSVIKLEYPLQIKRRGVETKLVIGGRVAAEPDSDLIKLIAMGRDWYEGLRSGRYTTQLEIRSETGLDKADVSRILNLAFLSPKIVSDILQGNHPVEMTAKTLKLSAAKLPIGWNDQADLLGVRV